MELRLVVIGKTEYEVVAMNSTETGMHYQICKRTKYGHAAQIKDLFRNEKNDDWTLWSTRNGMSGIGMPKLIDAPVFRTVQLQEV